MKILGVPKTTLSFNNLLERVTQFRKTIRLVAPVYYNKRIQIKIRWKKQHIRQCWGKFQTFFQLSVPSGVKWTGLTGSNDLWQHAWSTGNKITQPWFPEFLFRLGHIHMTDHPHGLHSPETELLPHSPRPHHKPHYYQRLSRSPKVSR